MWPRYTVTVAVRPWASHPASQGMTGKVKEKKKEEEEEEKDKEEKREGEEKEEKEKEKEKGCYLTHQVTVKMAWGG